MLLSSGDREDTSHLRVLRSVAGEQGGGVRVTFLFLLFTQLLQFKILNMPRCPVWGPHVLNPIALSSLEKGRTSKGD